MLFYGYGDWLWSFRRSELMNVRNIKVKIGFKSWVLFNVLTFWTVFQTMVHSLQAFPIKRTVSEESEIIPENRLEIISRDSGLRSHAMDIDDLWDNLGPPYS